MESVAAEARFPFRINNLQLTGQSSKPYMSKVACAELHAIAAVPHNY
jgi:hypothetical protein